MTPADKKPDPVALDEKGLLAAERGYMEGTTHYDSVVVRSRLEAAIRAYLEAAPSPSPAPGAVVEALRQITYERAKEKYGYRVAGDLVANRWRWPDTAPDFVDISLHDAITALAPLSQPAKGEREGGDA